MFVLVTDDKGVTRAKTRPVQSGDMMGDAVMIRKGLVAGERVAAAGSFKLRESAMVIVVPDVPGSGPATLPATVPTTLPTAEVR